MITLTDEQFDKLKQRELEILVEIDRVCRKNNIEYSLAYGSLIGAYRHGGFIPWDDDIDIIMTRPNFDRFMEIYPTELDPKFFYVDSFNNKHYALRFGKVMIKNTTMVETITHKSKAPTGIFLDIFVAEQTSNDLKKRYKQFRKHVAIRRISLRRCNYVVKKSKFSRFVYHMSGVILKILISARRLNKIDIKNKKKYYGTEDFKYYMMLERRNDDFATAVFPREWFEEYTDIKFEGKTFRAFTHGREILNIQYNDQYGDFMNLPPEEKRHPQHTLEAFDLGE